ncbi:MAG: site-specific integrase [Rhodoglobus sp.]
MPRSAKISLSTVRDLAPGDEVRDIELKGFGVRRQNAAISYFVHTRINGRLKRLTIGRHGSPWTPETARRYAAQLLMSVRAGEDPARARDERRRTSEPFEIIAARFLDSHGSKIKARTREEYAKLIRLQLGRAFNGKPVNAIKAPDVARAHVSWRATPRAANHALSVLSKLLTWATQHGYREEGDNPCTAVERYPETKRERYLSQDELVRLGKALVASESAGENPLVVGVIRMLVLTGARLHEMLSLKWDYLDEPRRALRLPDSKSGAKTIHLNPQALQVLHELPRLNGSPWVFPGHIHGRHLVDLNKPWNAIRSQAGLADVRLHDLRHSFASLPIIGHLLGHSQAQTTARYAHVAPNPAQRIADAAGQRIAQAWSDGKPTSSGRSE